MGSEREQTCDGCRFSHYVWREGDEYITVPDYSEPTKQKRPTDFVQCRRSPPVVVGDYTNGIDTIWPSVEPSDWCGEYRWGDATTTQIAEQGDSND